MQYIPSEIADQFKFDCLPGTAFIEVETFKDAKGLQHRVALTLNLTKDGWGVPCYCLMIEAQPGKWHLCPWINDELLNVLAKLVPPSTAFARLSKEQLGQLAEKHGTLEAAITARLQEADKKGGA